MKFSLKKYTWLLDQLIRSKRPFNRFTLDIDKGLLLRSDIDYDPILAADIAHENRKRNIVATFFVLVSGPFYSIFEPKTSDALRRIFDAGQRVGLHYHQIEPRLNVDRLHQEFEVLRMIVPEVDPVIAWHNPQGNLESLNAAAREQGFVSSYDSDVFGPGRYISDSNCTWDAKHIADIVNHSNADTVQVLCHPIIWALGGNSIEEILTKFLKRTADNLDATLAEQNSVWARRN